MLFNFKTKLLPASKITGDKSCLSTAVFLAEAWFWILIRRIRILKIEKFAVELYDLNRFFAIFLRIFHGLVDPLWNNFRTGEKFSWTDPLSLFHLFHDDLKNPFSLFHLFHVDLKTHFSTSPYTTCSTYSNLCQLVPFGCTTCSLPTLFSQIFPWVSQCHSIFRKTLLFEIFLQNTIMLERANNKKIYWNRLCLSQWDKKAGCTKPVPLGLGQIKRDLSLCHGTSHLPTMEAFPCAMVQALYHDGACTCSTCTNLCQKVGLQGRGILPKNQVRHRQKTVDDSEHVPLSYDILCKRFPF